MVHNRVSGSLSLNLSFHQNDGRSHDCLRLLNHNLLLWNLGSERAEITSEVVDHHPLWCRDPPTLQDLDKGPSGIYQCHPAWGTGRLRSSLSCIWGAAIVIKAEHMIYFYKKKNASGGITLNSSQELIRKIPQHLPCLTWALPSAQVDIPVVGSGAGVPCTHFPGTYR